MPHFKEQVCPITNKPSTNIEQENDAGHPPQIN
jgi:hypothetical protein